MSKIVFTGLQYSEASFMPNVCIKHKIGTCIQLIKPTRPGSICNDTDLLQSTSTATKISSERNVPFFNLLFIFVMTSANPVIPLMYPFEDNPVL